jgi:hypothetical protein
MKGRYVLTVALLVLLLSLVACGGAVTPDGTEDGSVEGGEVATEVVPGDDTGADTPAETPAATEAASTEEPATEPETSGEGEVAMPDTVITFTREGGFAGFCDELVVSPMEAQWTTCNGDAASTPLEDAFQQELQSLASQYQSFDHQTEDNPDGSDNMVQTLHFEGVGEQEPTEEVMNRLMEMSNELLAQFWQQRE